MSIIPPTGSVVVDNTSMSTLDEGNRPGPLPEVTNFQVIFSTPKDTDSPYGWVNFSCNAEDSDGMDEVILFTRCFLYNGSLIVNSYQMLHTGTYHEWFCYLNMTLTTAAYYQFYVLAIDNTGSSMTSNQLDDSLPPNWDVDMSGQTHFMDLMYVSGKYGQHGPTNGWCREDIDNNGHVHFMDLMTVSAHYNEWWLPR